MRQLKKLKQPMKNVILTTLIILLLSIVFPIDVVGYYINPLIFGTAFCTVNRKLLKYNLLTGYFCSILLSYVSFFIGFLGLMGTGYLIDKIVYLLHLESIDGNSYILMSGLFASISIYFLFSKIYHIQNLRKGFYIMLLSYTLVPVLVHVIPVIFKDILMTDFFRLYNLSWLLIVSLSLSYTINHNRIETEKNNTK
jgi:hypothetical protein